jgi:hypothetical protein
MLTCKKLSGLSVKNCLNVLEEMLAVLIMEGIDVWLSDCTSQYFF